MPDAATSRKPPDEVFAMEREWPRWIGSGTEIGRLAAFAERCISDHGFKNFNDPEFREMYEEAVINHRYLSLPQHAIFHNHVISAGSWASGIQSNELAAEIDARRDLTRRVQIKCEVIERQWSVTIIDEVRHRHPDDDPPPAPGPSRIAVRSEGWVAPQRIEINFQTEYPAAKLTVVAAGPDVCRSLFGLIVYRVEAGSRPNVWSERRAGLAGAALSAVTPLTLLACGTLQSGPAIALAALVAMFGCVIGSSVIPWAFPPLELVDAWEQSRWQKLKAWTFQLLTLGLAVGGIIVAVVLTSPSN